LITLLKKLIYKTEYRKKLIHLLYKINNIFYIIINIRVVKWEKKNKEKVCQNAQLIQQLIFINLLMEFNLKRKLQEPSLKSEN
jgi:hypothetical protein